MKVLMMLSCMFVGVNASAAETWTIDASHSSATFRIKHLVVATVTGKMSGINGSVKLNSKDITKSSVEAELDASTIWTDDKKRDDHLRDPDFLDVKKYPKIKFRSQAVKQISKGKLEVKGLLTIKNVTKPVTLQVDGPTGAIKGMRGKMHRGVTARVKINRQDFGVTWSKTLSAGGLVVGNEVDITIDLELQK